MVFYIEIIVMRFVKLIIMSLEIFDGLGDFLCDFIVVVLCDRLNDLYDFVVDYFFKVKEMRKLKFIFMYVIVDEDDEGVGELDKE